MLLQEEVISLDRVSRIIVSLYFCLGLLGGVMIFILCIASYVFD